MQDEVKVSQADRERAVQAVATEQQEHMKAKILRGDYDYTEAVQAFARHRHQAERDTLARMEPVAWSDVVAERQRQIEKEGWSPAHDDSHKWGQLAGAAACYALANAAHWAAGPAIEQFWPWDKAWWKPTDNRRNLVKAAALLLAEIERIDRAALPPAPEAGQ